ncbi:MAG: CapA family protein, partial [Polaromonas sp.]|nr:CapA family protein [Polaromonas sp.]
MTAGLRRGLAALCLAWGALAAAAPASGPVSLVFAGDIVLDGAAGEMIARGQDPFADWAAVFGQADIRLGNLECVIATTGEAGKK